MKKLFITGNLTKDVELKSVKIDENDVAVTTISVAVNEIGAENATFFDVEVWRATAKACANNLAKGSSVSIIAEVKANNYEKDGKKYYGYKFVADEVQFIGAKKGSEAK